jgi:hypothetical protein
VKRAALTVAAALLAGYATTAGATPSAGTYDTTYTASACGAKVGLPVAAGETALAVTAAATVPANDIVLNVFRNGTLLGSADSATSPEAFLTTALDPPAAAGDVVQAQVCPFADPTVPATAPFTATGTYAWGTVPATPAVAPGGEEPDGKKTVRVTALTDVLIPWGAPGAGADVTFPEGTYNEATLVLHDHPDGDGFDRLLTVEVDGVELFRATTPRVDYAISWDVTPYLALLSGGTHRVFVHEEAYLGRGHVVSAAFLLHTAKHAPPSTATTIAAPWDYSGLAPRTGNGCGGNTADVDLGYTSSIDETRTFNLPADREPVRAATFYGYLTAHGCEEFWYSTARPTPVRQVHLAIDGQGFADFVPKPYTYAFVGGDPNDQTWRTVDGAAWNTVQPAAGEHGVYDGTGAIPPYVFDVTDVVKGLAPGAHDLTIRIDNGDGTWMFSGEVLVAYGKGKPGA